MILQKLQQVLRKSEPAERRSLIIIATGLALVAAFCALDSTTQFAERSSPYALMLHVVGLESGVPDFDKVESSTTENDISTDQNQQAPPENGERQAQQLGSPPENQLPSPSISNNPASEAGQK